MSKISYEPQSFTAEAVQVVAQAEAICDDYAAQGYSLTLRQLYYRFIAGDFFPESRRDKVLGTKNTQKNYKWLGDLVSKARVGGLIDWNHIEDRTREYSGGDSGWRSPAEAVRSIERWYDIPHWDGQEHYLEVWVEKEALLDVIQRPAGRWRVGSMACKGSPSTSVIHEAANRLRRIERTGRETTIIYLGDHDPTGLDISRDIQDRLRLFRSNARVDRIALNMDQVEQYDPPPSPVKVTDSRTNGYVDTFGTEECWELDALPPDVLDGLVEAAILDRLDMDGWRTAERRQREEVAQLTALSENWQEVLGFMRERDMVQEPEETGDDDETDDDDDEL